MRVHIVRVRPLLYLLSTAAMIACSEDTPTSSERIRPERRTAEAQLTERFALELSSAPRTAPGAARRIQVKVRANADAPGTVVSIRAPQFDTRAGEAPNLAQWSANLLKGQETTQVIDLPYTGSEDVAVIVSAVDTTARIGSHHSGGMTVASHDMQWISELQSAIAGGAKRQGPISTGPTVVGCASADECGSVPLLGGAGRRGPKLASICYAELRSAKRTPMPLLCDDTLPEDPPPPPPPPVHVTYVQAQVFFTDHSYHTSAPIRRATASWSGPGVPAGSAYTSDQGTFMVPCSAADNGQLAIDIALTNPTDMFVTMTVTHVTTNVVMGPGCTPPVYGHDWWREAAAWEYGLRAVLGVRSVFGFNRPRIQIDVKPRPNSFYDPSYDELAIRENGVYGDWGVALLAHEFGHAVHAKTPNGLTTNHFFFNPCWGSHEFQTAESEGCALNEGFATYIGVLASPTNNAYGMADYGNSLEHDQHADDCAPHIECEHVFASVLYDLSDPVSSSDPDGQADVIQLPARQVFDAVSTCRNRYMGATSQGFEYAWVEVGGTTMVRDCLGATAPQSTHLRPLGLGVQTFWVDRSIPWSTPNSTVRAAINARFNR